MVIPQRRPGSKTRGFLRAYAPVLADYEIDQETFATFLKSFHKASQVCANFDGISGEYVPVEEEYELNACDAAGFPYTERHHYRRCSIR